MANDFENIGSIKLKNEELPSDIDKEIDNFDTTAKSLSVQMGKLEQDTTLINRYLEAAHAYLRAKESGDEKGMDTAEINIRLLLKEKPDLQAIFNIDE